MFDAQRLQEITKKELVEYFIWRLGEKIWATNQSFQQLYNDGRELELLQK